VRIFTQFDVLSKFVGAVADMSWSLVWIFSVIGLVCYVWAVFLTQYIRIVGGDLEQEVQESFSDVAQSMFTLFQVTTMDNWGQIAKALIEDNTYWMLFFVTFIAFTAWTMISLLTGVVSERIIKVTSTKQQSDHERQELQRRTFARFLHNCFKRADADGNGVLDREEFAHLIHQDNVTKHMDDLGVSISREELLHTFDMLDVDESGELTIDEFTLGLSLMQQDLSIKHVVAINYAIKRCQFHLQRQIQNSNQGTREDMTERVDTLEQKLSNLGGKFNSIIDHMGIKTESKDIICNDRSSPCASRNCSRSGSTLTARARSEGKNGVTSFLNLAKSKSFSNLLS